MRRVARADLMLLVTVCLWGFNVTVTKYVLTHGFRPLAYSAVRYGGAALLFCTLTYRLEGTLRVRRRDLPLLLVAAAFGVWLNQLTFMYAVKLTTATTVGLVLGTIPIFTALIARVLGIELLSRRFWVASAVSFGGVALVAAGSGGGLSGDVGGDLLAIATSATWAAYSVAIAPLMRRYSPYQISAFVLVAGWIGLAGSASTQLDSQDWGAVGWLGWLSLAFAVLGPLVLTNVLWFTAIDEVGPSRATLVSNLQPFVAAIFALAILSERITALQVLGGVAIGVGIVLSREGRRPRAAEPVVEEERLLATTVTVPLYGKLGDVYGRRPLFFVAIGLFLVGSALCGAAWGMPELIVFRAIQGFGAGGLFPLSLAVVGSIIPPRDRGRYQGLIGGVFAAASIAGPAVGGFLVDNASWRWVFYVNLPVGGLALLVVYLTMPKRAPRREHSIDWAGAAALAAGTTGLLLGLVWGGRQYAWTSGHVVGALAAAAVALALFARLERRARETILPFDLLRNRTVWASIVCVALVGMAMFGTIAFVPLFVQGVIGTSATSSGVVLTPLMLGAVTTSILSGQWVSRTGRYRPNALLGPVILAAGMLLLWR